MRPWWLTSRNLGPSDRDGPMGKFCKVLCACQKGVDVLVFHRSISSLICEPHIIPKSYISVVKPIVAQRSKALNYDVEVVEPEFPTVEDLDKIAAGSFFQTRVFMLFIDSSQDCTQLPQTLVFGRSVESLRDKDSKPTQTDEGNFQNAFNCSKFCCFERCALHWCTDQLA